MDTAKETVNGYTILHSIRLDGTFVVLGENMKDEKPYMVWRRSVGEPFGAESHILPFYHSDYLKAMREFTRNVNAIIDRLELDSFYQRVGDSAAPLTESDCLIGGLDGDLTGKVIAVKASILYPEYRNEASQLMYCYGGFGAKPDARGRAVFCTELWTGKNTRFDRGDILGVVPEKALPDWAVKKLSIVRNQEPQKESVSEMIRDAKSMPQQHLQKSKQKSEPER